jgi:hypothetical protein
VGAFKLTLTQQLRGVVATNHSAASPTAILLLPLLLPLMLQLLLILMLLRLRLLLLPLL